MENQTKTTIENFKPNFHSIDKTTAVFQTSSVTYSEAGFTYNTFSDVYGGSDRRVDLPPNMKGVINL